MCVREVVLMSLMNEEEEDSWSIGGLVFFVEEEVKMEETWGI